MSVEPFFVVHDKPSILVVDDTPGNLAVMTALLKDEYRVKVAHSGERALRQNSPGLPGSKRTHRKLPSRSTR